MKIPMKDSGETWLGKVPAHWQVVPATALFSESKERARDDDQMLSATQKYGVIPLAEFEAMEQRQVTKASVNLEMRKHVEVGDFVISMRSMDGGLERAKAVGSVRSSYSVLRASGDVEGRYFGALLKSNLYIQALRLTSNFIRDGQDLNFSHVKKIKLPKAEYSEQVAIADYLERSTARIDTLVAKKTRFIELLREKRQALITRAVTKGLVAGVPMKESGTKCLGEVPANWEITKARFIAEKIGSGKTPSGGATTYVSQGVPFLRSQNIHDDGLRLDDVAYISAETHAEMRVSRVQPRDVLLNITGASIGRSCIAPHDLGEANVNQHVCIVRCVDRELSDWMKWIFRSAVIKSQVDEFQTGAGREGLNFEQVGHFRLAIPPRDERKSIGDHLNRATARIDTLITKTERSLELLREHRTALITAAVTGKIDVREAA